MRILGFIFLALVQTSRIDAQANGYIKIMLGATDKEVMDYFYAESTLLPSAHNEVKSGFTPQGNKVINVHFDMDNEYFYHGYLVTYVFQRKNGLDHCVNQTVHGRLVYGEPNINYLKDNFVKDNDGVHWDGTLNLKAKIFKVKVLLSIVGTFYFIDYAFTNETP